MSEPSCSRCGALVVDLKRHEDWHQYHQQQLVRLVQQLEKQQKMTGGLIQRVMNTRGGADDEGAITVDLLAFATYWIGAGVAIGVLAWSVSEERWLPAGAMLLLALGATYLAYREIQRGRRPAQGAAPQVTPLHAPVPERQPHAPPRPQFAGDGAGFADAARQAQNQPPHQRQPTHQPQPQHQPPPRQAQHAAPQHTAPQHAAPPAQQQPPLPSYQAPANQVPYWSPNGQSTPPSNDTRWR